MFKLIFELKKKKRKKIYIVVFQPLRNIGSIDLAHQRGVCIFGFFMLADCVLSSFPFLYALNVIFILVLLTFRNCIVNLKFDPVVHTLDVKFCTLALNTMVEDVLCVDVEIYQSLTYLKDELL